MNIVISGTGRKVTKVEIDSIIDWNKTINNGGILFSDFRVDTILLETKL